MKSWEEVRNKVSNAIQGDDPKSISTLKYLLLIMDKAEEWGIEPKYAGRASLSNLREIIREARKAIDKEDIFRLEQLFMWAAKYSNKELRISIRGWNREVIDVEKIPGKHMQKYRMEVTSEQLKRFQNALKLQFDFQIEKD